MTANTFSGLDEIKRQLNSIEETEQNIKQQLIESNNENIVQISELRESVMTVYSDAEKKLTEAKVEMIDKINTLSESTELDHSKYDKRFGEIESIMQTQLNEIKDLGNDLIKTKQEIINETMKLSSLEESTKLAISKSENSTSEIQSSIKSQFKEMAIVLNISRDVNDIKNQLIAINKTEKAVKGQLSETQNSILVEMNELRESRVTVCSDIKKNLSQAKNEVVDQMKTLFSQSEKGIAELQSYVQTRFKEFKDQVNLSEGFSEIKTQLTKTHKEILTEIEECRTVPSDCREVQRRGYKSSGIYRIQPMLSFEGFLVWCDMSTRGGGWTYVINRFDGSQDFKLKWTDYKQGFGNLSGEHWLGLDHLYELTNSKSTELLFQLMDWNYKTVYALYDNFKIAGEFEKYRVNSLGNYSGGAGDFFSEQYNVDFSTAGNDCYYYVGGWWYGGCFQVHLTGNYLKHPVSGVYNFGVMRWNSRKYYCCNLKKARMMIRPRDS